MKRSFFANKQILVGFQSVNNVYFRHDKNIQTNI